MLENPIVSGLLTIALLLVVGYFAKLDMADMTGLARKAAQGGMKSLSDQLGYELITARTDVKQAGLKKDFGRFEIKVDANASRIQVDFKKPLGLVLSTLDKNDFNLGKAEPIEFSNKALNDFFPLRGAKPKLKDQQEKLEQALESLHQQFSGRKLKFLYVKGEYLRITAAYRHYLPASYLKEVLPVVEETAQQLSSL